jgi:hypothetical protein
MEAFSADLLALSNAKRPSRQRISAEHPKALHHAKKDVNQNLYFFGCCTPLLALKHSGRPSRLARNITAEYGSVKKRLREKIKR